MLHAFLMDSHLFEIVCFCRFVWIPLKVNLCRCANFIHIFKMKWEKKEERTEKNGHIYTERVSLAIDIEMTSVSLEMISLEILNLRKMISDKRTIHTEGPIRFAHSLEKPEHKRRRPGTDTRKPSEGKNKSNKLNKSPTSA